MSTSTDPDNFFQTTNSIAETERKSLKSKNNHGAPIRLQSKILAVIADPTHPCAVYIAESTGTARRIVLESNELSPPYTGATAPLTSLALSPSTSKVLFGGSWSRLIHSWSATTRRPLRTYAGHSDFVKAITTTHLPGTSTEILISGGADAKIIIWDIATGTKLHVLKPHVRSVLDLAILPIPPSPSQQPNEATITLLSADSVGEIRRFALSQHTLTETDPQNPIVVHQTSVYQLLFDEDGDLWTASADGDVVCLSPDKAWAEEMRVSTGSWARAVGVEEQGGWIITAGRDEEVRVWDKGTGKQHHTFSGHSDEITSLVILPSHHHPLIVTVSLDGTVRRWSLRADYLEIARREREREGDNEDEGEEGDGKGKGNGKGQGEGEEMVTEEEERELKALMEE